MKSIVNILIIISLISLSSCSDFLQESDKDQTIPRTTAQYESMLHQNCFLKASWFYASDIMTDDIVENGKAATTAKNDYKSLYSWQRNVEYDGAGKKTSNTNGWWATIYNDILITNYIIENIDKANGTQAEKDNLRAESYFLRAESYFELVNIYAPAYKATTASTTIGVPLRLDTGVQNMYTRNTLQEVYTQIITDINSAISYFKVSNEKKSLWHPNVKAAQLLLSRVYLYQEDWDNVIETATELINSCPAGLRDLPSYTNVPFVSNENQEILHTYGDPFVLLVENDGTSAWQNDVPKCFAGEDDNGIKVVTYGISNELLNSYWPGDCRPAKYLIETRDGIDVPAKWHSQYTSLGAYSYRLAEAYLNRAEAYASKSMNTEALNDMRELISHRVTDISKVTFPDNNSDIRKFVLEERRRELCGENHRWYDLKRTASWNAKQINHAFTLRSSGQSGTTGIIQGSQLYLLAPNDPNYTFELPEAETLINTAIELYGQRIDKAAINQN